MSDDELNEYLENFKKLELACIELSAQNIEDFKEKARTFSPDMSTKFQRVEELVIQLVDILKSASLNKLREAKILQQHAELLAKFNPNKR